MHAIPVIDDNDDWRLRRLSFKDSVSVADMHRDPRLSTWLLDDEPLATPRQAARLLDGLRHYSDRYAGLGMWAAERLQPGYGEAELDAAGARDYLSDAAFAALLLPRWRFCGWFNLSPAPEQEHLIELGSRLIPEVWGSRLSLLGGAAVLEHGFSTLQVPTIHIHCDPGNRSALYCSYFLGFQHPEPTHYVGKPACRLTMHADRFASWRALPARKRRQSAVEAVRRHGRSRQTIAEAEAVP